MDYTRIADAIDVNRMQCSRISIIGVGGSAGLAAQLVRCGAKQFSLFDPDVVTSSNMARQAHDTVSLGKPKVLALTEALRRINPDVIVQGHSCDVTTLSKGEVDQYFSGCDLLINATDRFRAHALGNEIALRHSLASLWVGLYPKGLAGEIIWWTPEIDACYRCLCAKRYAAHERAEAEGRSLDPASTGCTIFDISLLDSIAGMIAVGLLTRGAENRFGSLIEGLGDRNFIQVQLDSSWTFRGGNPVRELLGVRDENTAFFSWNTAVRSDPDGGSLPCPDCTTYRGHTFAAIHSNPVRLKLPEQLRGHHGN